MSGLRTYQDHRLELGDMIRAALHLARATGNPGAEEAARGLLARLASDRFRLAVMGQFSRGKSTLMNALLGGPYLPMGALPMTSVITTVRYGDRPRAMVRRHQAALPVEVPLTEVSEFVAQASMRRAELRVTSAEVQVPAELLRLGFEFVDTPGIGSVNPASTATTRGFLPEADAVVFVTGFDSPLTEAETGFLAEVSRHAGELFLVLNKRDLVSDQDAIEVEAYVRHRLRDDLAIHAPRVFSLSALEALEAARHDDRRRWSGSGLPALRHPLEEFLATDKTRLFLRNVADRAAGLVAAQCQDLRLGQLAHDHAPRVDEVLAAFDARITDLGSQQRRSAARISGMIDASLPRRIDARGDAWQSDLRQLIMAAAPDALSVGDGPVGVLAEDGRARLERAGGQVVGPWLNRRAGEVRDLLITLTADEVGALAETVAAPRPLGAQIAGQIMGHQHGQETYGLATPGWSAADVPDLALREATWTVSAEPPRRPRRRADPDDREIRRWLADALDIAVAAFEQRARTLLLEAARDWASRLREQAGRQLEEAAAHIRRCLRTPPRAEDLAALDDLSSRLGSLRAALAAAPLAGDTELPGGMEKPSDSGTGELDLPGGASPDAGPDGDCAVCTRMEQTLDEELRHGQLLLATREGDQSRHARQGGYCPLHTWQYASIASPLGISAGYAGLAAAIASALESADKPDQSPGDLSRAVAALTATSGDCVLCQALAACERAAVADIVSGTKVVSTETASALCLRHLSLALAADPVPEAGRTMLRAVAADLRRDSDGMRGYALKREALHRYLVTGEESRAYLNALRRLAGSATLILPGTDPDS